MRPVTQTLMARLSGALVITLTLAGVIVAAQTKLPTVVVYKTPTCGCCGKWVEHLQAAGFKVETQHRDDLSGIRQQQKVPSSLLSCHTALVGSYVVEGHVPAADVKKLLAEKPSVKGIAVPGMPAGSPGMESPSPQKYDTLAFTEDGKTSVFAKH
jgi:hypothetical protein